MRTLVTNAEIEEVGESLIQRYICNKKPSPKCIDIEGFIKDFLHLPLVYEALAEDDKDKIGFVSDGNYPLNVHRNQKKEQIIYPKGTVVLDHIFCMRIGAANVVSHWHMRLHTLYLSG